MQNCIKGNESSRGRGKRMPEKPVDVKAPSAGVSAIKIKVKIKLREDKRKKQRSSRGSSRSR